MKPGWGKMLKLLLIFFLILFPQFPYSCTKFSSYTRDVNQKQKRRDENEKSIHSLINGFIAC